MKNKIILIALLFGLILVVSSCSGQYRAVSVDTTPQSQPKVVVTDVQADNSIGKGEVALTDVKYDGNTLSGRIINQYSKALTNIKVKITQKNGEDIITIPVLNPEEDYSINQAYNFGSRCGYNETFTIKITTLEGQTLEKAYNFFEVYNLQEEKLNSNIVGEMSRIIIIYGNRVAAYPTQEICPNEKTVIGVEVLNVGNKEQKFKLDVSCTKYIDSDGNIGADMQCNNLNIFYTPEEISVNPSSTYIWTINIKDNDAQSGTYLIEAKVSADGQQYGDTQKIYVKKI